MRATWVDWYGYQDVHADWRREAQRERLVREALGNPRFYLPGDIYVIASAARKLFAWVATHLSPSRPEPQEARLSYQPRKRRA